MDNASKELKLGWLQSGVNNGYNGAMRDGGGKRAVRRRQSEACENVAHSGGLMIRRLGRQGGGVVAVLRVVSRWGEQVVCQVSGDQNRGEKQA